MNENLINNLKDKLGKSVDACKNELATIRATGANPSILAHINVNYYDAMTPLTQMANIKAPDATQLVITPFDKSATKDIVKAIVDADMGFNPVDEGDFVRMGVPPLTGENRATFVKEAKAISEKGKIAVRNIRQSANKDLDNQSDISDNEKELFKTNIQTEVDNSNKAIEALFKEKQTQLEQV